MLNQRCFTFFLFLFFTSFFAQSNVFELRKELKQKLSKVAADDVKGYQKLAKWCNTKKLKRSEKALYQKILKLDPENEQAHKKLGHVKEEEQWYSSFEALMKAKGKIRLLKKWAKVTPEEKQTLRLWHDHWLTEKEVQKLEKGGVLQAHDIEKGIEVLTREYRIQSALGSQRTLNLARILEQAIRIWRKNSNIPYPERKEREGSFLTLQIKILRSYKKFQKMIKNDIETFSSVLTKAHGYFDGTFCYLSYFHDWYRTTRILLHEARHQYDSLITKRYYYMPRWYSEGIAEYYSQHLWEEKILSMGKLNPKINYSLHFVKKLLQENKIVSVEKLLKDPWMMQVNPAWYQNVWAFVYFLKHSQYSDGFQKWEEEMLQGKFRKTGLQLESFQKYVAEDLSDFDKKYQAQLKEWTLLSPKNIRR